MGFLDEKSSLVSNTSSLIEKTVTDKDEKNKLIFNLLPLLVKSQISKWVRAVLAVIIVVAVMFFGDRITLTSDNQFILLSGVVGFYFLDYAKSFFSKK